MAERDSNEGEALAMPAVGLAAAYARDRPALLHYLRRRLGQVALAEDLVQDLWLRLLRVTAPVQNPRAFLFEIAANLARDHVRKETARSKVVLPAEAPETAHPHAASPEQHILDRERLARLVAAVDTLPPKAREVFILRRFEDLSQEEIARRLGISRNMVQKHLRLAMRRCLEEMDKD